VVERSEKNAQKFGNIGTIFVASFEFHLQLINFVLVYKVEDVFQAKFIDQSDSGTGLSLC
jgi:hypothetical protein